MKFQVSEGAISAVFPDLKKLHPPRKIRGRRFYKVGSLQYLENSEIDTIEGAVGSTNSTAPFLHTRSFNILRRSGIGVKRKTSDNQ